MLDIHTEETRIERDTCTPMFIAALFIIARAWNFLIYKFIYFNWRLITLQYCIGFLPIWKRFIIIDTVENICNSWKEVKILAFL